MMQRLRVGEQINGVLTVSNWNKIADAVDRVAQLEKLIAGILTNRQGSSIAVLVSNDTGATRNQFDVVRLDGLKFTGDDEAINTEVSVDQQPFSGLAVSSVSHWGRLAIFQEPVADGEVGLALISGVSYANVKINSASHTRAYPTGTTAASGAGPLRILYAPDPDDDPRPAIVLFDYANMHYQAKAASTIAGGASGTVKIWDPIAAALTNIEISAKNEASESVAANKLIGIQQEGCTDQYYVNWELCG